MTRAERRNRIRTAYHEAGHAVIAAVYGFWPHRVTIVSDPEKDQRGETRIKVSSSLYRIPHELTALMIFELAGMAAQNRYSRRRDAEYKGGQRDLAQFEEDWWKLNVMTDGQCGDAEDFERVASQVVNHNWYAIETLVRVLLVRETIAHDELRQALNSAICTDKYEHLVLPGYLCPVDPCTVVDRDVSAEAEVLKERFAARLNT